MEHATERKEHVAFRGQTPDTAERKQYSRVRLPNPCIAILATCCREPDYLVDPVQPVACQQAR